MLDVSQLSCSKKDRLLFEDLSFHLYAGELLHLKGANGAGKTSLLRLLVGLVTPESGDVRFEGQSISNSSQHRQNYHHALTYLGHKTGVKQSLSALENMRFWCAQQNIAIDEAAHMRLLTELGLVGLEDIPVGHLSAGQQRRVALTRFWLKTSAKLWVMDEPFTALDVTAIAVVEDKIQQHLQQGGAAILTSHQALSIPCRELTLEYRF